MSITSSLLDTIQHQKIFIAALDWGMGHLSRTAAIIQNLHRQNDILIFSSSIQRIFYAKLFPDIKQVEINPNHVHFYPRSLLKTFLHSAMFIPSIFQEKQALHKFIKKNFKPDLIISDQRYGFYHPEVKNIFVTHQVQLSTPVHLSSFNKIHQKFLIRFDEVWIPDYEDEYISIAGKLSHNVPSNIFVQYIQPQSLMKKINVEKKLDYLFIISGTDSEKRYFEKEFEKISQILLQKNPLLKIHIIGSKRTDGHLWGGWKNFEEANLLICSAKNIITRAGYSTLMDLHKILDATQQIYLINTPHQYEQDYLFQYWIKKGMAKDVKQLF